MTRSNWLILLGIVALMLFWMLGAHNRVTALRNAIHKAWMPLDELLQQREQALLTLVDGLRPLMTWELATLEAARSAQLQLRANQEGVRRKAANGRLVAGFAAAEAVLLPRLAQVLALLEREGRMLDGRHELAAAVRLLKELEPRLDFARQALNEACSVYNEAIAQFPTRMLAPMLGFAKVGPL